MAAPVIAGMPPSLDLDAGWQITLEALDPTTGNPVAGVTVANVSLMVRNLGGGAADQLAVGPFMLVPGPGA